LFGVSLYHHGFSFPDGLFFSLGRQVLPAGSLAAWPSPKIWRQQWTEIALEDGAQFEPPVVSVGKILTQPMGPMGNMPQKSTETKGFFAQMKSFGGLKIKEIGLSYLDSDILIWVF